jgi:hypothetical protein
MSNLLLKIFLGIFTCKIFAFNELRQVFTANDSIGIAYGQNIPAKGVTGKKLRESGVSRLFPLKHFRV